MVDRGGKSGQPVSRDLDKIIGAKLKFFRNARGISQTALGKTVGLTFQQIQKYENGANRVSVSRLVEFSEHLDFSLAEFFEGISSKPTKENAAADALLLAMAEAHVVDLIKQFSAIKSPRVKRQIVDLVKVIQES